MSNRSVAHPISSPPEPQEPRTVSGEQRIALPAAPLSETRVSARLRLPENALPTDPPPLAESEIGKATARMGVPESLKLLRAALPTGQSFEPIPPPPTSVGVDKRRPGRNETANALVLFVLFLGVSAVVTRVIGALLFR